MESKIKVFHLLQRAHAALFRAADKALRAEFGLTSTQQAVLFLLLSKDAQPITSLAAQLRMGKSSLTGLVDRMVEKGLVRRGQGDGDGRVVLVYIADAGRELAQKSLKHTTAANRALLVPFNEQEQVIIARFLNYVSDEAEQVLSRISKKERQ
jgi:DNA-binding MarR family transcriptional regulator